MKTKTILLPLFCLLLTFCASTQKHLQKQQENDPKYQYNMGLFYLNNGNPERAIPYLLRSNSLKPGNYLVHHALGLAYSMDGRLEKAIAEYQTALKINPRSTETRNMLGVSYQQMGFLDKAEEQFKAAIEDRYYASRALPLYNLARLYYLKNKYQDALFQVESALALDKRFVMALNLKGIILESLSRFPEAIDTYKQALSALDPSKTDDIEIQYNLACTYFKNKDYSKARSIFEKIYSRINDPEKKKTIDTYLKIMSKKAPQPAA